MDCLVDTVENTWENRSLRWFLTVVLAAAPVLGFESASGQLANKDVPFVTKS